jgi:hypothetical protein
LLQNKKQGTPVIPVFLAEIDPSGDFTPFDFSKAKSTLPNVTHARGPKSGRAVAVLRYYKTQQSK